MQCLVTRSCILNNLFSFSQDYCPIQPSFVDSLSSCEMERDTNLLAAGEMSSCSGSVTQTDLGMDLDI